MPMNLKQKRLELGLTQQQIADAMGTGRTTVAMWEAGASMPPVPKLQKLAKVLGCSMDDLLDEKSSQEAHENIGMQEGKDMRTWLVEIRKAARKSQQAVADAAGISQTYYAGIETGTRGKPLGVPVAKAIAGALGFDWKKFYDEDENARTVDDLYQKENGTRGKAVHAPYPAESGVQKEPARKRSELSLEELEAIYKRIQPRAFEEHLIRCVESEGQQWMVLADGCRVLGYKNPQHQAKYLREEEKCKLDIALKNTLVNCVNRSGLRRVCLLSAKDVGQRLSDWADREVFVERR